MTEAFIPLPHVADGAPRARRTLNWRLVCALLVNLAAWTLIVVLARRFLAP